MLGPLDGASGSWAGGQQGLGSGASGLRGGAAQAARWPGHRLSSAACCPTRVPVLATPTGDTHV